MDEDVIFCRICFESHNLSGNELISPCACSGTIGHVHKKCLLRWIDVREETKCKVCNVNFDIEVQTDEEEKDYITMKVVALLSIIIVYITILLFWDDMDHTIMLIVTFLFTTIFVVALNM